MNIALITDENYVTPTATAIASVLQSNPEEPLHFYIITNFLDSKSILRLNEFIEPHKSHASMEIISLSEEDVANFPIRKGDHVSIATYYRIFFPKIIPGFVKKLLYIDGDILCTDSIKSFYEKDLKNFSCAVCHDERNDDESNFYRLKYPKESGYFNAGIMLINLAWWRDHNIMQKCLDYIASEPEACLWHDQDALNHVLNGTVFWADFRYNFTQGFYFDKDGMNIDNKYYREIDNARKNPCILHFSSTYKPWHIECNHPLKQQYRIFYRQYSGKKLKLTYRQKGFKRFKWHIKKLLDMLSIKHYEDFRKQIY